MAPSNASPPAPPSAADALIAAALASVERREAEARAAKAAEPEVVFDEDGDEDGDWEDALEFELEVDDISEPPSAAHETDTLELHPAERIGDAARQDATDAITLELVRTQAELARERQARQAAQDALELAQAAQEEAEEGRKRARRAARKYKQAAEREADHRQRLGGTQARLRERLGQADEDIDRLHREKNAVEASLAKSEALVDQLKSDIKRMKLRQVEASDAAAAKAVEKACKELLPVLDNLTLGLSHADADPSTVVDGLQMTLGQFTSALGRVGVEPVASEPGTPFDPNIHDAMQVTPSQDVPPRTVLRTVQQGFRFRGRLIRPARVVVAAAPPAPPAAPPVSSSSDDTP